MISATKISIAALLVSLSSFLLGGVQYYSARKDKLPAPGFDCQLVDSALKLREGGFYDYIEIPSRCTIRNLGSFAFTVDSVIPITFDGLSNITFDRGLDQLQLDYYNKGFDPSQIRLASLEFPIEVKPRSLTRFEMGVLVPLFFYGEKETDKLERREKSRPACLKM